MLTATGMSINATARPETAIAAKVADVSAKDHAPGMHVARRCGEARMERQFDGRPFFACLYDLHPQVAHQSAIGMVFHPFGQFFRT
jgi:hypothetical protein